MSILTAEIIEKVHSLPDLDKIQLVELLMADLDQPDPEIDRLWAEEAKRRWEAIQKGSPTFSMQETFGQYR
jgi:hypothetical protein